jgi:hypothetical protein
MNKNSIKAALIVAVSFALAASSHAVLVIAGVTDGELSGGNPKAIILQAGAPVADLSLWGVGSANNGLGTNGVEYTLPAGTANTGDVFVIVANQPSFDFFFNNFVQNFTLLLGGGAANINGDDAVELFLNGAAFDTYGDINVNGDGETWDYTDGYAVRIGGGPGAFDQANYQSVFQGFFDNKTEAEHVAIFANAGFTPIPEPATGAIFALSLGLLLRRRR